MDEPILSSEYIARFDVERHLGKAPDFQPCAERKHPGLRAIFYEGAPFRGKPTRCFAWLGLPKGANATHRVPGIVLVHGGGGTAFADWADIWVKRGYAAIAMDTCGALPDPDAPPNRMQHPPRLPDGGPPGWGGFEQLDWPAADQWMYHATAAVLRATALLRSLPSVEASQIGIAGVSWGGYLTLGAVGIAPQGTYRFAIPVYASTRFATMPTSILLGRPEVSRRQARQWMETWDPAPVMENIRTPMLFLSDAEDIAFPMPTWQETTDAVSGMAQRSLRIAYPHNHSISLPSCTEAVFAEAILKRRPLPKWGELQRARRELSCAFQPAGRKIVEARLCATRATGFWADRRWLPYPATLDPATHAIQGTLPFGATAFFFQVKDDQSAIWSSPLGIRK